MFRFRMMYDERYNSGDAGSDEVDGLVHRDMSWPVSDGAFIEFLAPGGEPRVTVHADHRALLA